MFRKLIYLLLILIVNFGCSKEDPTISKPAKHEKSFEIYKEAVASLEAGDYFYASKKFAEAETILPKIEFAAKASIMSSYCLYIINFYDEAIENLERFIKVYPADKNIAYANYLLAVSLYEQILDEKKDIVPLLKSKEKIEIFLNEYPNSEYALDLKFKLDLINNQLAAKELYIAKFYIQSQKWIPAINRLKVIVEKYSETIFIEEALHRLVEIYYRLGLTDEAKKYASMLGYNYQSGEWYEKSYKIFNKNYEKEKIKKDKKNKKTTLDKIKSLLSFK